MKTCLKTIVLSALSTLVAFSGLTYSSCNPDPCKAITCAYGGVCKDGECLCATGYEGVQCEKVMRDKFLGTWSVSEIGTQSGPADFSTSIEPAQAIQDVVVKGMYNGYFHNGVLIRAHVNNDTLYIDGQYHLGKYVEGIGYINPNTSREEQAQMILRYYVQDSLNPDVVNDFGWDEGQPSVWYKDRI